MPVGSGVPSGPPGTSRSSGCDLRSSACSRVSGALDDEYSAVSSFLFVSAICASGEMARKVRSTEDGVTMSSSGRVGRTRSPRRHLRVIGARYGSAQAGGEEANTQRVRVRAVIGEQRVVVRVQEEAARPGLDQ